jgi:hypothetical protein
LPPQGGADPQAASARACASGPASR